MDCGSCIFSYAAFTINETSKIVAEGVTECIILWITWSPVQSGYQDY
jgi:hypothetical protein